MRDSEHSHGSTLNLVEDCIRKVAKNMSPDRILAFRPHQRIDGKPVNCLKRLGSERIGGYGAALKVPEEGLSDFCLCLGQDLDAISGHKALSLALASFQETALTAPFRRAA